MKHIIDFHSHILPGIDDGSKNTAMSRKMLDSCAEQGVTIQIATPHFYANHMQPEDFLRNRQAAYEKVVDYAGEKEISLLCGAEVAFFRSIGYSEILDEMTISDTRLLLLEMPFREWTSRDLKEVELLLRRGIHPIIAHIERFYSFQSDKGIIDDLIDMPVTIQVNAEALLSWRTRGKMLKLFRTQQAQLLGSDCHNLTSRPPNLQQGREVLEKKLGQAQLQEIDTLGMQLLKKYHR